MRKREKGRKARWSGSQKAAAINQSPNRKKVVLRMRAERVLSGSSGVAGRILVCSFGLITLTWRQKARCEVDIRTIQSESVAGLYITLRRPRSEATS